VEAFPIQTEKAMCLLKKIIPRFRIPVSIGSDNGPAFVTEVVQLMAKRLKNNLKVAYSLLPPEFRKNKMYTGL
jgi:hypothetical protein